jgi:SAM-dependent methyltransferase
MREITSCEVCGNPNITNDPRLPHILDFGSHPLQDDLVPIGDKRVCERYPIGVLFCETCKTAHQRYQLPKTKLFKLEYTYRSNQTKDVLDGMEQLVDEYEARYGPVHGKKVLDVGCNDGSLLDVFWRRGAHCHGIDPTDAAKEARKKSHAVRQAFFDVPAAVDLFMDYGVFDIITFTNVFAHIEHLPSLLRALRILIGPNTRIVIENHYLGAVLATHQFDTFFHEHIRTYSYSSFRYIAAGLDMVVDHASFPRRYGGNIRVILGAQSTPSTNDGLEYIRRAERNFGFELAQLNAFIKHWKSSKRQQINELTQYHGSVFAPMPAIALPARAPLLISMLGLDRNQISAVYQIPGSAKIGHYVPGTRIPILSDEEFPWDSTGPALNLAWHIPAEIEARYRGLGFRGEFIQVISEDTNDV